MVIHHPYDGNTPFQGSQFSTNLTESWLEISSLKCFECSKLNKMTKHTCTDLVTSSLLELLIAAKKSLKKELWLRKTCYIHTRIFTKLLWEQRQLDEASLENYADCQQL